MDGNGTATGGFGVGALSERGRTAGVRGQARNTAVFAGLLVTVIASHPSASAFRDDPVLCTFFVVAGSRLRSPGPVAKPDR